MTDLSNTGRTAKIIVAERLIRHGLSCSRADTHMNAIPLKASDPSPRRPWRRLALLCMCAASLLAATAFQIAAQDPPATRQGQDRDGQSDQRGADRDGRSPWREPTPQEWEAARLFLEEHSPRRLEIYDEAVREWRARQDPAALEDAELPRSIRGARSRIFTRVHFLWQLRDRDEDFYRYALRQFNLEDQIYGHLMDEQAAEEAGNEEEATRARDAAAEATRRYAEGTLEERSERIRRMREELEREEQRLEQDRSNVDRLVERLIERFERGLPRSDRDRGRDGDRPTTRDGASGDSQRERSGG